MNMNMVFPIPLAASPLVSRLRRSNSHKTASYAGYISSVNSFNFSCKNVRIQVEKCVLDILQPVLQVVATCFFREVDTNTKL